jgi:hypothetical protein
MKKNKFIDILEIKGYCMVNHSYSIDFQLTKSHNGLPANIHDKKD